jgi:fructose-1,6-bisphosphatase
MSISSASEIVIEEDKKKSYSINSFNVDHYTKKNSLLIKRSLQSEDAVDIQFSKLNVFVGEVVRVLLRGRPRGEGIRPYRSMSR